MCSALKAINPGQSLITSFGCTLCAAPSQRDAPPRLSNDCAAFASRHACFGLEAPGPGFFRTPASADFRSVPLVLLASRPLAGPRAPDPPLPEWRLRSSGLDLFRPMIGGRYVTRFLSRPKKSSDQKTRLPPFSEWHLESAEHFGTCKPSRDSPSDLLA